MQRRWRKFFCVVIGNLLVWFFAQQFNSELMAQVSATAQNDGQAQIDKGRQTVGEVCVACHTNILRMVQVHKKSPEQWRDTVYSMIGRGAQVMPDEIGPVTAFLAASAGSNRQTLTEPSRGGRSAPATPDQQTADAQGRAILQRSCVQCHDLATASAKLASEDWNAVITRMTGYGARLTPADQQKLVEYLNSLAR
jgi:mono/diheme cytochrome c family protein